MGDKIYVPYQEAESEFVEKRSRFIGHVWPVDSEDQAQELIRRVKNYERLASKAIREKSRTAAVQALTLHPLVNSYSLACALTDAYIAHNKGYCDGWH